jgi:hypothetical protein
MATNNRIYLGTEVKLDVSICSLSGITMDEYDFSVETFCSSVTAVVTEKKNAIRKSADHYIVCVDTTSLGVGRLKCKVTSYIPDADFPDGIRTEVSLIDTGIDVVRAE